MECRTDEQDPFACVGDRGHSRSVAELSGDFRGVGFLDDSQFVGEKI